jgi:uncharacterized membrane protein YhaH (DUF805 family)
MDWTTLLFSFQGRINRGKYWLAVLIYMVVWTVFIAAIFMWIGKLNLDNLFSIAGGALLFWLIGFILFIAGTWSGLAVGVKRLHDRDKSGWWILLFYLAPSVLGSIANTNEQPLVGFVLGLASFVISIWGLVELGFLRGTVGPNPYGPDPLQRPAAVDASITPAPAG